MSDYLINGHERIQNKALNFVPNSEWDGNLQVSPFAITTLVSLRDTPDCSILHDGGGLRLALITKLVCIS